MESRPASYLSSKKESGNSEGEADPDLHAHLTIVVLGASGDLAVKKTYPALFALFRHQLIPQHFSIVGYARSAMKNESEFHAKISAKFGNFPQALKEDFLRHCWYHQGQYDSSEDFGKLDQELTKMENKQMNIKEGQESKEALNRIFYMALPPTAFVPAAKSVHAAALTKRGWNRVVVEKPFGRDTASSEELGKELGALFTEDQLYRIDHYLGKEMVQNLMVLRFANKVSTTEEKHRVEPRPHREQRGEGGERTVSKRVRAMDGRLISLFFLLFCFFLSSNSGVRASVESRSHRRGSDRIQRGFWHAFVAAALSFHSTRGCG